MQISVEKPSVLGRRLTVTIPAADVDPKVEKHIVKSAKTLRLDGFRPGKVPLPVVKKRFGPAFRQEVLGEIIQKNLFEALEKESLTPVGLPEVDFITNEAGKDLVFNADFEVYPDLKIKDLDQIEVEKLTATVKKSDVDKMVAQLQEQRTTWNPVERSAQDKDRVKIDFVGRIDDKEFDGGAARDHLIVLGSGSMIPGFESGIEGMKLGEEKVIKVTFPEDYHGKDVAGKEATFTITLHEVNEPELPELNDEFAKNFGSDDVASLQQEIKDNMERELKAAMRGLTKEQVIDGLIKVNDTEVPKAAIAQEAKHLSEQFAERMKQSGMAGGKKQFQLPAEMFHDEAEKRVKIGVILSQFIDEQNIEPNDEKIDDMLAEMTAVYEDSDEVIKQFKQDQKQMAQIKQAVVEQLAIDKILAMAKVTEIASDFSAIIEKARQGQ